MNGEVAFTAILWHQTTICKKRTILLSNKNSNIAGLFKSIRNYTLSFSVAEEAMPSDEAFVIQKF